jgi:AraC-like DNA-binding protein
VSDTRGILHPRIGLDHFRLRRYEPSKALSPYLDRLWCVSWNLPEGEVFDQPILAHPCVNVVIEPERAAVYGVPSRLGRQRLAGSGWAVAAMFAPGGAGPFLRSPARAWIDQVLPVADHWGAAGAELVSAVRAVSREHSGGELEQARLLDTFLAGVAPAIVPAGTADAVAAAALISADRTLCRVEDLATRTGIETRSLQRLFADHVGLSPKRVIRRYRLLEAAEAAAGGLSVSWAEVAAELGFSDQAHLTRDFTAAFGLSPGRYVAQNAGTTG